MKLKKVFKKLLGLVKKSKNSKVAFKWDYDEKAQEILAQDIDKFNIMTPRQSFELLFRISDALQKAYIDGYEHGKKAQN